MVRNRSKEKVCLVCWSITGGGGFQDKKDNFGIKLDEDLLNQFRKEKKDKECDLLGKILNKLIDLEEGDGRVPKEGSNVSVCSNCKTLVSSAIESKCKTLEVGDRVEKLQQSILEELKELQLYLDIFYLQMKKIENVMGKNDVEDLSGLIPGDSSGGGLKDELLNFRDSLAKVMTDFRFYRDNVKKPTVAQEQKTSISPSSSTNLNDGPTTAESQNGHGPGLYLLTLAPLNGTTSILNNKNDNSNERKTSSPSTVIDLSSDDDMSDMDISPSSTLNQSEQPQTMAASKSTQVNKDSSDAAIDNKSKTDSKQPKRKLSEDVNKEYYSSGSDSEDSAGKKEKERKPKKSKVIRKETKAVSPTSSTTPEDPTTVESGIGAQTGIPNDEKTPKEITSSESGKTEQSVMKNGEKSLSPTHQQNVSEAPDVQTSNGDVTKSQQNDENYSCGVCHVQHQSEKEHMRHMEQHWTDDSQSDTMSELGQEKELQLVLTPTPASSHKNVNDIESKQQASSKSIDNRFKSAEDVDSVIEDLIGGQIESPSDIESTTCISSAENGMKRTSQEKEQNKDIAEEEIPIPGDESVTTVACTSTSSANSSLISNGNSKNNDNGEATSDSPQSVERIPDTTNVYLSPNLDF